MRQRETVAAPIVPNPTNNALPATGLGGAGATMMDAATGATKGVHVQDLGQAASAVVSTQGEVVGLFGVFSPFSLFRLRP